MFDALPSISSIYVTQTGVPSMYALNTVPADNSTSFSTKLPET